METRILSIALGMLGVAIGVMGQQVSQDPLLDRARRGDDSALSQMQQSGDLQGLQSLLHDPDYAGEISARLLLAKLGDREALQYLPQSNRQ
jgi:hypothetical protein